MNGDVTNFQPTNGTWIMPIIASLIVTPVGATVLNNKPPAHVVVVRDF